MNKLAQTKELTTKQSLKIKDVVKQYTEGRIVELAIAMKNSTSEGTSFSRSSGSYHSRSGHDFSRAGRTADQIIPNYLKTNNEEVNSKVDMYLELVNGI